ncbi:heterokaryon incompatibility protein-domain-containing protein [Trametes polyzona]|nr:heterokaryon incompatibility protein-domain-containing protein [Trametes polyzona]
MQDPEARPDGNSSSERVFSHDRRQAAHDVDEPEDPPGHSNRSSSLAVSSVSERLRGSILPSDTSITELPDDRAQQVPSPALLDQPQNGDVLQELVQPQYPGDPVGSEPSIPRAVDARDPDTDYYWDGPAVDPSTLPPQPSTICRDCWRGPCTTLFGLLLDQITYVFGYSTGGYAYTVSWATLESAARSGCVWCTFLVGPARIAEMEPLFKPNRRFNVRLGTLNWRHESAQIINLFVNDRFPKGCKALHIWVTAETPLHLSLRYLPLLTDVRSARVFDLVKAELNQCTHGEVVHEGCRVETPVPSSGTFPTRLVDCSNADRPRLVETNGARPLYVALSYVWGPASAQPCRTTMANVDEYTLHGLDSKTLPQTILDAILVTRALGFQYLWLDMLCIIQDSAEDKHREMACMRDIYRYAYLTIIAASASGASEGFLQDRPALSSPATIPALPFTVPSRLDSQRQKSQTGSLVAVDTTRLDKAEPVNRRAWCLQELLMSSRSLIYTSSALLYRCPADTVAVGGGHYNKGRDIPRLPSFISTPATCPSTSPIPTGNVHEAWWDVVEAYSGRDLSYPSDKLVACAGLAEEFSRVRGGPSNYLCGLWRDTLLHDLLWYPETAVEARAEEYRAPSWSWASLDGAVRRGTSWLEHDRLLAEVVESAVVLEDNWLPFGAVTGGHLVLRVPFILAAFTPQDEDGYRRLLLQTAEQAHSNLSGGKDRGGSPIGGRQYWAEAYLDAIEDAAVDQVWAALIHTDPNGDTSGLIVALADTDPCKRFKAPCGHRRRAYRRIGYFGGLDTDDLKRLGWDGIAEIMEKITLV